MKTPGHMRGALRENDFFDFFHQRSRQHTVAFHVEHVQTNLWF
jgi:hypothetical protein